MTDAPNARGTLVRIALAFARYMWIVALCFVVSLSITVVGLTRQVPLYRSAAKVATPGPAEQEHAEAFAIRMNTRLLEINSSLVLSRTREMVNRPAEEIAAKLVNVFAAPERGTSVVRLSVDATDPVFAADFANAWAESVLDFAAEQKATYRLLDRATPAYAPVLPRRLESIWRAAFVGLAIGILLASVPTALRLRRAPGAT